MADNNCFCYYALDRGFSSWVERESVSGSILLSRLWAALLRADSSGICFWWKTHD